MMEIRETIQPLERVNMPQRVSELIRDYISKNKLKAGDKLPAEKALAEMFNIGSRSVREGLKLLQARGFLEIQQGKGIFVAARWLHVYIQTLTNSLDMDNNNVNLLVQLMDVRKLLETAIVKQFAMCPLAEKLDAISGNLQKQKEACVQKNVKLFNSLDVEFHRLIVDSVNNTILSSLYRGLMDLLFVSFQKTLNTPEFLNESYGLHLKIFNAIKEKKPDRAFELMSKQIDISKKKLQKLISV
ncbi:MAG: FadR family transcriptional regulator [Treponema sp.]|jgi:DNA-binding FadR family transcriptional regulator|nr:FadR family transcriptional regulator [Treponema sp.]